MSNIYHITYIEEALNRFPGRDPIIMWDLNAYIGHIQNPKKKRVVMYKAGANTVLLYARESWVVADVTMKVLEGSHHIFS